MLENRSRASNPLVLSLDACQHAVGLQVCPSRYTGTPGTARALGRPQPKFTHVSTFSLLGSIISMVLPSQPSVPYLIGLAGVPDVHGAPVGSVGIGISYALDEGHLPLVVQLLDLPHGWIKPDVVIDGQDLVLGRPLLTGLLSMYRPSTQYGSMVSRPSLPPDSWTTTSTVVFSC